MAKRVPSSQHLTPKKVKENRWAGTVWVDNYYGGRLGRPELGTVTFVIPAHGILRQEDPKLKFKASQVGLFGKTSPQI